jgi:hypothetical protein
MSRDFTRTLLLAATMSLALAGSACSSDDQAGKPAGTPIAANSRPAGSTTGVPAPGVVAIAIVTKMDDTTVSWTDAQTRSSETGDQAIEPLTGTQHQHSAPLAANATFTAATGCGSTETKVDVKGLGALPCTAVQFREQVVGKANAAPAITFDAKGQITKMAARFHR